jgi:oligosaccharide repeat unit polymerase
MLMTYLVVGVMSGITAIIVRRTGMWSIPSFATIIFTAGFGLRALLLTMAGRESTFGLPLSSEQRSSMLAWGLFAFVAFSLGMFATLSRATSSRVSQAPTVRFSPWRLLLFFAALVLVQLLVLGSLFGGTANALTALSTRTLTEISIGPAANITFLHIPVLLFAITSAIHERNTAAAWTSICAFLSVLPLIAIINGRAAVIFSVWALAMSIQIRIGAKTRIVMIAGMATTVVAASILGLAQRISAQDNVHFSQGLSAAVTQGPFVVSDSLPLFDHMAIGIAYSAIHGHDSGASLPLALGVFLPDSMWPNGNKPPFLPEILGESVVYNGLSGLPAGLLGEGYLAFGPIGSTLYAFIFGLIVGLIHRKAAAIHHVGPVRPWLLFQASAFTLITLRTGAQGGLIALQVSLVALTGMVTISRLARVRMPPSPFALPTLDLSAAASEKHPR